MSQAPRGGYSHKQMVARKRHRNRTRIQEMRGLLEDLAGPIPLWPRAIQRNMFVATQLNDSQRFATIVFLMGNGVDPLLILEYFDLAFYFNQDQQEKIRRIINRYPGPDPRRPWTYWNVSAGHSSEAHAPGTTVRVRPDVWSEDVDSE